jgi:hypothetical protein
MDRMARPDLWVSWRFDAVRQGLAMVEDFVATPRFAQPLSGGGASRHERSKSLVHLLEQAAPHGVARNPA